MAWLRLANLALGVLAMLAPIAHVLELPNKIALDATLWLAVQKHLYRGWGPFLGGPAEVGALTTSLCLATLRWQRSVVLWPTLIACIGYAGMLAAFFTLNAPVNVSVSSWTPASVPSDWSSYRARWETGHAVAALLSVISLAALAWAWRTERRA
ncbi:MAG TPA: hypothetical protein VHY76_01170 [Acetobacteraceae bacterium]|nr:hypothetical protein [Acetobacteraceae bacterium]